MERQALLRKKEEFKTKEENVGLKLRIKRSVNVNILERMCPERPGGDWDWDWDWG
ncbi:hypothetical protein [Paenibacillus alvei]|uniref:hypothetical protein n=1 Tax=Paenibacillus alvei TaxID=44250 RepID=UPI0018CCC887|nr:hypothetical protein [Paenibacillus alvei]MCY9579270.1 hypothetical protein [Paenibacillus alvei]MCY9583726.1 hypothetical protein [Paenibacillus alvei]